MVTKPRQRLVRAAMIVHEWLCRDDDDDDDGVAVSCCPFWYDATRIDYYDEIMSTMRMISDEPPTMTTTIFDGVASMTKKSDVVVFVVLECSL
jgi:hypothetical protein